MSQRKCKKLAPKKQHGKHQQDPKKTMAPIFGKFFRLSNPALFMEAQDERR